MSRKKIFFTAIVIGGTVGLATGPSWSQGDPRGSRPANPEQSRPGTSDNAPAAHSATQELSTNDMKLVQQRLREKGYDPGTINGTADETTRAAIRRFRQLGGTVKTIFLHPSVHLYSEIGGRLLGRLPISY